MLIIQGRQRQTVRKGEEEEEEEEGLIVIHASVQSTCEPKDESGEKSKFRLTKTLNTVYY